MVQGSMTCVKYLMFVFNFIFVVCGIALITVGAIVQGKDFTAYLDSKYVTAPTILIVVGCLIFFLAFLGCCGAVRENHCMVMTFGILLFLIFVIEIAGGIAAYTYRNQFEHFLRESMNDTIKQGKEDSMKYFDEMQTKWHCCGVDGPSDYLAFGRVIPKSCCAPQEDICDANHAYPKGCFDEMLAKIKSVIGMVGATAIGIGVIELIGVMFSWCLASAIKKEYEGV